MSLVNLVLLSHVGVMDRMFERKEQPLTTLEAICAL